MQFASDKDRMWLNEVLEALDVYVICFRKKANLITFFNALKTIVATGFFYQDRRRVVSNCRTAWTLSRFRFQSRSPDAGFARP